MNDTLTRPRLPRSTPAPAIFVGVLLYLYACTAPAAEVSYTLINGNETRTAQAEQVSIENVPYLPLAPIFAAFGGRVESSGDRVEFSLNEIYSSGHVNSARVESESRILALKRPLVLGEGGPLIAQEDLAYFLREMYGATLRENTVVDDTAPVSEALPEESEIEEAMIEEITAPIAEPVAELPVPATSVSLGTVIIDPGHGGNDIGVASPSGLAEKDLVLAIAEELRTILKEQSDLITYITRNDDSAVTLQQRMNFANQQQGDLFISLHAGASYSVQAHGFEIFYMPPLRGSGAGLGLRSSPQLTDYSPFSRAFAESIATELEAQTSATNRGLREMPVRQLSTLSMPGLLIEVGFLTNASEEALLESASYQRRIAEGIAQGILRARNGAES